MSNELDVRSAGRRWTFTLNRPEKLNALNGTLVDELLQAVEQAHAQGARLLVFRGAGKSFSAGFDLSDLEAQSEGDLVLRFVRIEMLLQAVAQSPAQTLGLAHGKVFGAGVDLFAVCRQRVAAPDAVFRMPGLKFGLVLGTRRFGRIVGNAVARSVLEEVGSFDAQRASDMGFVNRIAAPEQWDGLVAEAEAKADVLDDATRGALYRVLGEDEPDADLASLVRSAARFGLKDRLRRYLGK
ncbi:enoyl-CoA hydratase/isomerase family protein [Aquincola sp. S2]|uniref:Enoyl-CoA hydratase/isomerase family protein n=1 Tax=Pseudaquabacterium terrae TaxID=2732868 RepID=A0ABX2EUG7_9BURK|nr:enoyl-CoA hydratase/isomerase family protein [Aquabacterium terrae]NRF72069.1 enoyl-CoA hydratase/isomerase family protein [Aquabacterium terrae]